MKLNKRIKKNKKNMTNRASSHIEQKIKGCVVNL